MNVTALQTNLKVAGYDPGVIDGVWGPKTLGALMAYTAPGKKPIAGLEAMSAALIAAFGKRAVITPLRIVHFLAQAAHESMGFRALTELGSEAYFAKYNGRADLGNVEPGDGPRYRGRGLFQITGRANYRTFGRLIDLNLEAHPEIAAHPEAGAQTAVEYWHDRGLNGWADQDNIMRITRLINGGQNGIVERKAYLTRLKNVWGLK